MVRVDLIPGPKRDAYRRRTRMHLWGAGIASYGLFLLLTLLIARAVSAGQPRVTAYCAALLR